MLQNTIVKILLLVRTGTLLFFIFKIWFNFSLFSNKNKMRTFQKSTHHSTSFPPVSAPILTNRNETGNIDRFDNSQTVRTMMLCFVFSGYYNRVPKRCQAFRFKFYRNFTSYTAFLRLFLSVFSFFLILD